MMHRLTARKIKQLKLRSCQISEGWQDVSDLTGTSTESWEIQLGIHLLLLLSMCSVNCVLEAEASPRLLTMEIVTKHLLHINPLSTQQLQLTQLTQTGTKPNAFGESLSGAAQVILLF